MAEISETSAAQSLQALRDKHVPAVGRDPTLAAAADEATAQVRLTQPRPAEPPKRAVSLTDLSDESWVGMAAGCPHRHAMRRPDFTGEPWSSWVATCRAKLGTGCLIILCGDRGSGKTQIATELIRYARHARAAATYVHVMDFFLSIRQSYQKTEESPSERAAIDKYLKPQLLVIDEIHERGETDWEDRLLRYMVDRRYGNMTDTVVVGNLRPEALFEQLGKSVRSRWEEIGEVVTCQGVNFRGRKP